jgi:hypothetical protein
MVFQLDISKNHLCGLDHSGGGTYTAEGITAIADALRVNGGLTSIDLSRNQLCGIWTDGDGDQQGTYTAEGITAIADALRVNGSGGMYYDDMNLVDLKELAEKRGIKAVGKGWPTCCPPNGNKADIIKALEKHGGGAGGALTECNIQIQYNPENGKEGEALIRKAMQGKAGFNLQYNPENGKEGKALFRKAMQGKAGFKLRI